MEAKLISNRFQDKTVAELVTEDYRKAQVFKKFGIDFCCGGKKSVAAACEAKGVDVQVLAQELTAVEQREAPANGRKFQQWEIDFLADYIVNEHHKYVKENIPLLLEFTQKVARVHGERHPETLQVAGLFLEVSRELDQHLAKEEHILFPYMKRLQAAAKSGQPFTRPPFQSAENPIRMMEEEHDHAGNLMKQIRKLTGDFTPPPDACNTYRVTYFKLQEFEDDLHRHIHLENNILFPKTLELERQLMQEDSGKTVVSK